MSSLSEGFENIALLAGRGWFQQNNSQPVGITGWSQGPSVANGGPIDAHAGSANSFISANFNNTTGGTGSISNWLVTPELDFGAGATFTFHTRKSLPDNFADRIEVRLSLNGAGTNVGSGASGTGDFSRLLLSINPDLALGVYPTTWTSFTLSHAEGLPHSGSGRIAFRYHVTSAGPSGAHSDFIGLDTVSYTAGPPEYSIGVIVSGLTGSGLTVTLDGGAPMAISQNGIFRFPGYVAPGTAYTVAVETQPGTPSQTCTTNAGTGTATSDVLLGIACTTDRFTVGGTISDLVGSGLRLTLGSQTLIVPAYATNFVFPNSVASGSTYAVAIASPPRFPHQVCTLSNGGGTIGHDHIDDVGIACALDTDVLFANDFEVPPTPTGAAIATSTADTGVDARTSIASPSVAESQADKATSSAASGMVSATGTHDADGVSSTAALVTPRGTPDAVPLPTLDRVALAVLAGLLVLATAWTRRRRAV
ncbi:choice-of-anchor J domain-containing protein [Dokdonella sp. MW10]|uniref:choice-of-anchor J domain-containing protein n=1 Tax=Dokdonella sp. MW10 TaxID=2992926 RepID=UPI003F7D4BE2